VPSGVISEHWPKRVGLRSESSETDESLEEPRLDAAVLENGLLLAGPLASALRLGAIGKLLGRERLPSKQTLDLLGDLHVGKLQLEPIAVRHGSGVTPEHWPRRPSFPHLAQAPRLPRAPAPESQTPTLVAALLGDLGFPALTGRAKRYSPQTVSSFFSASRPSCAS
jgi:hypothetical protein